jgi:sigma-B regulation protein RsbU (phosphoserine phosphatase)
MKILIVEAAQDLQNQLNQFFVAEHYDVIKFENGVDAENFIREGNEVIDVILCDLDEPTQFGFELIKFIQKQSNQIPFVFITTSAKLHNIINELHRGVWSYFIKPILNLGTLLVAIEQLYHQQHLLLANDAYKEELADKHKELQDDHLAGSKLHKQLLPVNNVNILNLNFSYFLYPSLYISGDFIDYQQLSERYAIFYLSDVSGHGVSSAFVTVLLKACIQQYCSEYIHMNNPTAIDPRAMLSTINKLVYAEKLGKYLTMVYMVYDKELSKIIYSVAGHFPFPIYIEEGKTAEYIGERGYPIGMFNEATFVNYEKQLSDKFKIVIFSDGLIDIRPEQDLQAKEQSIIDILTAHHDKELDLVQQLLEIDPNNNLPDDICGLFVTKN